MDGWMDGWIALRTANTTKIIPQMPLRTANSANIFLITESTCWLDLVFVDALARCSSVRLARHAHMLAGSPHLAMLLPIDVIRCVFRANASY